MADLHDSSVGAYELDGAVGGVFPAVDGELEALYVEAEKLESDGQLRAAAKALADSEFNLVLDLGRIRHAARGVALTLVVYKIVKPEQDVRRHKAEFEAGFSARVIDTRSTVPFLKDKGLPYNVETHWLSQTFSFAGPFVTGLELKTVPKKAGPLMIRALDAIQASANPTPIARATALALMYCLIEERNKGKVDLTRPKGLSISSVCKLLKHHFAYKYKTNAPRLPQVAIYAMYSCLVKSVGRYASFELQPLERLKTANRKSGTVGDIDIEFQGKPIEAVEVKFDIQINADQISEAIAKIKSASVERYFILSTKGITESDRREIDSLCEDFRKSNGCEIVVGDAVETLSYYLRLLRSTNDYINQYADLLETDADLDYEHRLAWNDVCATTSV